MANWFKMYEGTVADPRLGLIAKKLKTSRAEIIAIWLYLLEDASKAVKRGSFTASFEEISFLLDVDEAVVEAVIEAFRNRLMLSGNTIADWEETQPMSDAERQRKSRANKKKQSQNVTNSHEQSQNVTPREKEREKERKIDRNTPLTPQGVEGEEDFNSFWNNRPKLKNMTDGKQEAMQEYNKLINSGVTHEELNKAMINYAPVAEEKEAKGREHFYKTAKWLSEDVWQDYTNLGANKAIDTLEDLPEWQQKLGSVLKAHEVRKWFEGAEFNGNQIKANSSFSADWIKTKFSQAINNTLGKVEVIC